MVAMANGTSHVGVNTSEGVEYREDNFLAVGGCSGSHMGNSLWSNNETLSPTTLNTVFGC